MAVLLRPAVASDAGFLTEMLVEAAYWRPTGPPGSVEEVLRQPELAHYVTGWPRPGDLGVVAEDGPPVGAAWVRAFGPQDPGYGFVDAAVPELAMGVVPARRREGVGVRLVGALVRTARAQGLGALSLSVEDDNHARRMYERSGFVRVGGTAGSSTMLLRL